MAIEAHDRPLISAGTLLGIGMGGFVDGILLHQLLQTHNMMSAKRPKDSIVNMEINMFWDGLFHSFTWLMTAAGIWLLWRAVMRRDVVLSGQTLLGSMIFGWGLFNLVEGVIDHHVLHLHHVVERLGVSIWDWAFLGSGVLLIAVGWTLIARARRTRDDARAPGPAHA
jgi:uncharacterized membrane protein